MEQQTGSKLGTEYTEAVYCHPAHLTYTQSTLSLFTFMHWDSPGKNTGVGCHFLFQKLLLEFNNSI